MWLKKTKNVQLDENKTDRFINVVCGQREAFISVLWWSCIDKASTSAHDALEGPRDSLSQREHGGPLRRGASQSR